MNKIVSIIFLFVVTWGCGNRSSQTPADSAAATAEVLTVDALLSDAATLVDHEVTVKGTVMHVCKQGGGRCFLMGSSEDFNLRVEAGEKIGAFSQEQMGSDLTITGVLRVVKTEADAHNTAREHSDSTHEHDAEAEEAHQIIVQAEERAEVVYFMEGLSVVKEEI